MVSLLSRLCRIRLHIAPGFYLATASSSENAGASFSRITRENDARRLVFIARNPKKHRLLRLALSMLSSFCTERCAVKRDETKMRTLLRQSSTGLYFQGPDKWTADPTRAHNFKMIDWALDFVHRWHLHDLELAFAFDDLDEVTRVPIDKIELRYSQF
jgi:hypothetical protein